MNECLDYINGMPHGVVAILGSGKTFKSGTLYTLLDSCPGLKSRPIAFYKFPNVKELFPFETQYSIEDFDDVEPDSICVVEDANRIFPSRSSSKFADIQEWMGIISHKDILLMLTLQNTSNVDLAFFRDQDVVLIHKKMHDVAVRNEREEFQLSCQMANILIDECSNAYNVPYHYISYVPKFNHLMILDHPPVWHGYEQSHALRDYKIKKEKKEVSK